LGRLDDAITPTTAVRYRDGLIIAFLAHRPIRAGNLTAITLEQQLTKRGGSWWLTFSPSETKTGRLLEFPLPRHLAPYLEDYLNRYRPFLLSRGGRQPLAQTNGLWISRLGSQMGFSAISHQVKLSTKEAFGTPVNLSLFRDCAATAIAITEPEDIEVVAAILGHACITTSEKFYNQARSVEAGQRYHETLAALSSRAVERGRSPRGKRGSSGDAVRNSASSRPPVHGSANARRGAPRSPELLVAHLWRRKRLWLRVKRMGRLT
jgi:integrase